MHVGYPNEFVVRRWLKCVGGGGGWGLGVGVGVGVGGVTT